ncbi:MAG: AAA family ATPase [Bacteroidota bacterium]
MFNICPNCGHYHVDKVVTHTPEGSFATCPACEFDVPFVSLPLFCLTGPSGVGKSTIGYRLLQGFKEVVLIETDLFWIDGIKGKAQELMLRVAKNVMQAGKPVVLEGTIIPEHLKDSVEKRYFRDIHYIVLTYTPEDTETRLKARPWWRSSGSEAYIQDHINFNQWIEQNLVDHPQTLTHIHTSDYTIAETEEKVKEAIRGVMKTYKITE